MAVELYARAKSERKTPTIPWRPLNTVDTHTSSGVIRDTQIAPDCLYGFPNYEEHRARYIRSMTDRLAKEGKTVQRVRLLNDGWIFDWERPPSTRTQFATTQYLQSTIGKYSRNPIDLTLHCENDDKDTTSYHQKARARSFDNGPSSLYRRIGMTRPKYDNIRRPYSFSSRRRESHNIEDLRRFRPPARRNPSDGRIKKVLPFSSRFRRIKKILPKSVKYASYAQAKRDRRRLDREHPPSSAYIRTDANSFLQRCQIEGGNFPSHPNSIPISGFSGQPRLPLRSPRLLEGPRDRRHLTWPEDRPPSNQIDLITPPLTTAMATVTLSTAPPMLTETDAGAHSDDLFFPIEADYLNQPGGDYVPEVTTGIESGALDVPSPVAIANIVLATVQQNALPETELGDENDQPDLFYQIPSSSSSESAMDFRYDHDHEDQQSRHDTNGHNISPNSSNQPECNVAPQESAEKIKVHAPTLAGIAQNNNVQPGPSSSKMPPIASTSQPSKKKVVPSVTSTIDEEETTPDQSLEYTVKTTVVLPKPQYARARRLLARDNLPFVWVSMPGDFQFISQQSRTRIQEWSLPAPERKRSKTDGSSFVVSDAALLGDSSAVVTYESGPNPASLITFSANETEEAPRRRHLSHSLLPQAGSQRQGSLTSLCAVNSNCFVTGGIDHKLLFWKLKQEGEEQKPSCKVTALAVVHAASVGALAYDTHRKWVISSAGSKLGITDISSNRSVMDPGRHKWATYKVHNIHMHSQNENLLLIETGDIDRQSRVYDIRQLQAAQRKPLALVGSTETVTNSQYQRGDWIKTLIVQPSCGNIIKVWDMRNTQTSLFERELDHAVTHAIFTNGGRGIVATGKHFVTFFDV